MKHDFAGKQYLRPDLPPTPPAAWWTVGGFVGIIVLAAIYAALGGLQ